MEISKLLIPEVDSQYSIGGLPCFGVLIPPEMKDENHEREAGIFWTKQLAILPCIAPLVAALKTLPQLRELTLRKGRENLNLGYKKNHEAALGQTRGELAAAACADCLKQNGPFAECVVVASRFVGACCNCHYSSQGHRCSLRHFGPSSNTTQPALSRPNHPKSLKRIAPPPRALEDCGIANLRQHTAAQNPAKIQDTSLSPAFIDLTSDSGEGPDTKRQRFSNPIEHSAAQTLPPLSAHKSTPAFRPWSANEIQHFRAENQYSAAQYQRLREQNQRVTEQNQELASELEYSRQEKKQLLRHIYEAYLTNTIVIKNVVVSNAVIEAAVDAREAEMRVGLSNLGGTEAQVKEQAMQLLNFSNDTTFLVSRLVVGAMQEHQAFISDEEHMFMQSQFDNAKPNAEVAAIMDEKLEFVSEKQRTDDMTLL